MTLFPPNKKPRRNGGRGFLLKTGIMQIARFRGQGVSRAMIPTQDQNAAPVALFRLFNKGFESNRSPEFLKSRKGSVEEDNRDAAQMAFQNEG